MSQAKYLSVNDDFFEIIDTEKKAYWLGFLLADGYVSDRTVCLKLKELDGKHVHKFSEDLNSEYKVSNIVSKNKFGNFGAVATNICSRKMVSDLSALGVTKRKSFSAVPPSIDSLLERHMMRGIFDGDGSIYTERKNGNRRISLCGSLPTCNRFSGWVFDIVGSRPSVAIHKNIFGVRVAKQKFVEKILEELYKDCTVSLDRKMLLSGFAEGGC